MRKYRLNCPIRKANPYRRMAQAMRTSKVADNLLKREFREHGPRSIFLTDITYIPYNGKFCYLSVIMDAYTKEVMSYVLSESLEIDFVLQTVNKFIEKNKDYINKDALIHSDQGCHYTSIKFIELIKNSELRQSMSRRGNCWDNAPQESFFGHMKDELNIRHNKWKTINDVREAIDDYMDYYNNDRYQWNLNKLSPVEYYTYITTNQNPIIDEIKFSPFLFLTVLTRVQFT